MLRQRPVSVDASDLTREPAIIDEIDERLGERVHVGGSVANDMSRIDGRPFELAVHVSRCGFVGEPVPNSRRTRCTHTSTSGSSTR